MQSGNSNVLCILIQYYFILVMFMVVRVSSINVLLLTLRYILTFDV